jgi:hypothetical protein
MRQIPLLDLYDILRDEEETTVLELLEITSEELVAAFKAKIRAKKGYLDKYYEAEQEEELIREFSKAAGLGSKEAWEAAFGELEEESYK